MIIIRASRISRSRSRRRGDVASNFIVNNRVWRKVLASMTDCCKDFTVTGKSSNENSNIRYKIENYAKRIRSGRFEDFAADPGRQLNPQRRAGSQGRAVAVAVPAAGAVARRGGRNRSAGDAA